MDFGDAQRDLVTAYVRGAPGVLVSGLVWLAAGLVWLRLDIGPAFVTLFIGGMLIHPLSLFIARALLRAPGVARGNPLVPLALESTFFLFAGLMIAYALLLAAPALAFPAMAITIGARYFVFRTLYAEPVYWALAASLVGAGALAGAGLVAWPGNIALVVAAVEIVFAVILFARQTVVRSAA